MSTRWAYVVTAKALVGTDLETGEVTVDVCGSLPRVHPDGVLVVTEGWYWSQHPEVVYRINYFISNHEERGGRVVRIGV